MNKNFKFVVTTGLVVLLAALAVLGGTQLYAATQKKTSDIGFVDVEAVFNASPQKKAADKTINAEYEAAKAQIEKEIKNLAQDKRDAVIAKYEQKLAQHQQQLINDILKNIDTIIRQVADEQGIKAVFDRKNIIYGGQDLTQQVKDRVLKQTGTNK